MSKVTSKLQVTVPKTIADQYGIRPGDDIEFVTAEDGLHVDLPRRQPQWSLEERLALFAAATKRQQRRNLAWEGPRAAKNRGWKRDDLYDRARHR